MSKRKVDEDKARQFAVENQIFYLEISAKDDYHIAECFHLVFRGIISDFIFFLKV